MLLGGKQYQVCVSVPLVLEYEEAGKRLGREFGLTHHDVEDIIDYICSVADLREIHYLWRPILKDPKDDHILELAVEASAKCIITYNKKDFVGVEGFGVRVLTPREFLIEIGDIK
jgi:predicted nucleic acid-binding protein